MKTVLLRSQWTLKEELIKQIKESLNSIDLEISYEQVGADELEPKKEHFPDESLTLIKGELSYKMQGLVAHMTSSSHFSGHMDCIENYAGRLWGRSLLSHSFEHSFLRLRKSHSLGGRVLFLGSSPLANPLMAVLAKMGFSEFSFLSSGKDFERAKKQCQTLIGVKVQEVVSTDLIQSSKEYSLCFVLEKNYPDTTLSDLSYFHFLSVQSLVLEMTSGSNFPFSEVKALGTEIVSIDQIREDQAPVIIDRVKTIADHFK